MSAVCWTEVVTPERQSTTVPKVSNSTTCTRAIRVTARCGPYGVIAIPPLGGLADTRTPVPDFQLTVAGGAVGRHASRRRRGTGLRKRPAAPQRPSDPAITRWAATHVWMKEEPNWILTQPLMGRWLTLVGWIPSSPATPRCASR